MRQLESNETSPSSLAQKLTKIIYEILKIEFEKKNLPLQDRQQKHVSCTALVMNNNSVLARHSHIVRHMKSIYCKRYCDIVSQKY